MIETWYQRDSLRDAIHFATERNRPGKGKPRPYWAIPTEDQVLAVLATVTHP